MASIHRTFRVFISSTFQDFQLERNYLAKEIFPRLDKYCQNLGYRFQAVDYRWGISDQAAINNRTVLLCNQEIKRCQFLSPRPNFLILLGDRYGWCPPPPEIAELEFNILKEHISDADRKLVTFWYKLDQNALSSGASGKNLGIYLLQPRTGIYSEFVDPNTWNSIEQQLHSILKEAAMKCNFTEDVLIKYTTSVTHQEIVNGAFEAIDPQLHVHAFFRSLPKPPLNVIPDLYFEEELPQQQKLIALKTEIKERLSKNVHEYQVESVSTQYLGRLGEDIFLILKKTIEEVIKKYPPSNTLMMEIDAQNRFGEEHRRIFVGRNDLLQHTLNYIQKETTHPLIFFGKSGSGKSSLMAKIIELCQTQFPNHLLIARFIGTTGESSFVKNLLFSLCHHIQYLTAKKPVERIENKEIELEIPFGLNDLIDYFPKQLGISCNSEKPLILILDALDQIPKQDLGRYLKWLPQRIPAQLKLIVSVALDSEEMCSSLRLIYPKEHIILPPLSSEEGRQALSIFLQFNNRSLQPSQLDFAIKHFNVSGSPLYLKLISEQAITWHSYTPITSTAISDSIEGIIQQVFILFTQYHDPFTIKRILGYLRLARNGLNEEEILKILGTDKEFFDQFCLNLEKQHRPVPPEKQLPWAIWARIYNDLAPYLTIKNMDDTNTIHFFHRQFESAIDTYVFSSISKSKLSSVLVDYFSRCPNYLGEETHKTSNKRRCSELLYHCINAENQQLMIQYCSDLDFIKSKLRAGMVEDLNHDFKEILDHWPDNTNNPIIRELARFFRQKGFLFLQTAENFIQELYNEPEMTGLPALTKKYLEHVQEPEIFLELLNKPLKSPDWIINYQDVDVHWRNNAIFSRDGKTIFADNWKKLELIDVETGGIKNTIDIGRDFSFKILPNEKQFLIYIHNGSIFQIRDIITGKRIKSIPVRRTGEIDASNFDLAPNGKYLIISDNQGYGQENRCVIWNFDDIAVDCEYNSDDLYFFWIASDKSVPALYLHSRKAYSDVEKIQFSPNGREYAGIYWDNELQNEYRDNEGKARAKKFLTLWDLSTGRVIRTFDNFLKSVNYLVFSNDAKYLVTSDHEGVIILWDVVKGVKIKTFLGHSDSVICCAFSPDGRFIASGSSDKTIILWNIETGKPIYTYHGHSGDINSISFSRDGTQLVSASNDGSIKIFPVKINEPIIYSQITYHAESVFKFISSPNGKYLLSGTYRELKLWDRFTFKELVCIKHENSCDSFDFSPKGDYFFSQFYDLVMIHDITGSIIHQFSIYPIYGEQSIIYSPDGMYLLCPCEMTAEERRRAQKSSGYGPSTLQLIDNQSLKQIWTITVKKAFIRYFRFSPDGKYIAIISQIDNNDLRYKPYRKEFLLDIWNVSLRKKHCSFDSFGRQDEMKKCEFSPNNQYIVVSLDAYEKYILIGDLNTKQEITLDYDPVPTLKKRSTNEKNEEHFSYSGKLLPIIRFISNTEILVFINYFEEIIIYDLITRCEKNKKLLPISMDYDNTSGPIDVIPFSNSRFALTISRDHTLKIWNLSSQKVIKMFVADSKLKCISINSDHGLIICGSDAGNLYCFQLHGLSL